LARQASEKTGNAAGEVPGETKGFGKSIKTQEEALNRPLGLKAFHRSKGAVPVRKKE